MNHNVEFTLSFEGNDADKHEIDLYDVAFALMGFQRSIALTTHLVLNQKIITQAPSLKGAKVLALPPEEGSWKVKAGVILTAAWVLGTTSNDNPVGHLVHSLYDYVISESLGFHVDYNKSLGLLYEENKEKKIDLPVIEQHQADSLIEKCSTAIKDLHRPIYKTKTANRASISANTGETDIPLNSSLSQDSFDYIKEEITIEIPEVVQGRISSYNSNTYKGRIYVSSEGRPIPFELTEKARTKYNVQLIIASLSTNAHKNYDDKWSKIYCRILKNTSRSGHLKSYVIMEMSNEFLSQ